MPGGPPAPQAEHLFRARALEELASPDRLDLAARLISPLGWLLLAAGGLAVAAILAASVLITVPLTLTAPALILPTGQPMASLFFQPSQARPLRSGMAVTLTTSSGGTLTGTLLQAAPRPQGTSILRGQLLAEGLGQEAIDMVLPTGQLLTEAQAALAAPAPLEAGLPARAEITLGRQTLLNLLVPALGQAAAQPPGP